MRIIICVTNDIVTDQRVNRTARSLKKLPSDIVIAGIKRKTSLPADNSLYVSRRFSLLFKKGPMFYAEYNIRLFFFLLFSRADILVSNDLDTLAAVYLAAAIKKAPVVYDSHEYFTELPELVDRKSIRSVWQWIEKLFLPKVKYSYTVSDSIAAAYNIKYGISMKVVRNLPYRIYEIPLQISTAEKKEKLIIYQGALNMGRGLELAIQAMKYSADCKLIIAGGGYLKSGLEALVRSLALDDRVIFRGMLKPEELVNLTATADIGISLEESKGLNYIYALPNKLFDYIQARIPVLVSDLPEMSNIITKYKIGRVIQTDDPRRLAEMFDEMLYDTALTMQWKHNLEIAASELCWENEETKLMEIFLAVVKDHAFEVKDRSSM